MAAMMTKSSLRMARVAGSRPARLPVRVRATEQEQTAENGTVFYAGKSYTETEVRNVRRGRDSVGGTPPPLSAHGSGGAVPHSCLLGS